MDDKVRNGYLYDFYGPLFTERQKQIYEDYALSDLSFSEIAEDAGISRQAAHDLVSRCTRKLQGYEEKLRLLERFLSIKARVEKIRSLTEDEEICALTDEILEEL